MSEDVWNHRFLELAKGISSFSKDPSTQVGAVLVDEMHRVISVGYNGFPRGVDDSPERYADRPTKYSMVVHAEVNAILTAEGRARGCTLYVFPTFTSTGVCDECAKVVIQAGIERIVKYATLHDPTTAERWAGKGKAAETMLSEAGVSIEEVYEY